MLWARPPFPLPLSSCPREGGVSRNLAHSLCVGGGGGEKSTAKRRGRRDRENKHHAREVAIPILVQYSEFPLLGTEGLSKACFTAADNAFN